MVVYFRRSLFWACVDFLSLKARCVQYITVRRLRLNIAGIHMNQNTISIIKKIKVYCSFSWINFHSCENKFWPPEAFIAATLVRGQGNVRFFCYYQNQELIFIHSYWQSWKYFDWKTKKNSMKNTFKKCPLICIFGINNNVKTYNKLKIR